jgi:hypothetical protein
MTTPNRRYVVELGGMATLTGVGERHGRSNNVGWSISPPLDVQPNDRLVMDFDTMTAWVEGKPDTKCKLIQRGVASTDEVTVEMLMDRLDTLSGGFSVSSAVMPIQGENP